jgi:predicted 3-demethylubiquinone-9 3-methyltransferase (glyoxalase superfamily)
VQMITTFLMFDGKAEEAMELYVSLFPDSAIVSISRYGENEEGVAGSVRHAVFSLNGQRFMSIDSTAKHAFAFTPAISLYVGFDSESALDRAYLVLSEGGQTLMPLDAYPFSRKYAWVNDKFGVSWQLALVDEPAGPGERGPA